MKMNCDSKGRRTMRYASGFSGVVLALVMSGAGVWAQTASTDSVGSSDSIETIYLVNVPRSSEADEILTALRNLLDKDEKVYFVPSQNAITLRGTSEQLVRARKLLKDLDRPKKTYRLTYTISDMEDGKRIGVQHFDLIVVAGQKALLRQGNRVPVVTGNYTKESAQESQVTYLDVGLIIDASLDESANGVRLRTKMEKSSVAEEKSGVGAADPVIRQTTVEGTANLTQGKPVRLGSVDVLGSTRRLDVEVVSEIVQ
jgi:type II secretory pathway component GspD/PulD (secretin)